MGLYFRPREEKQMIDGKLTIELDGDAPKNNSSESAMIMYNKGEKDEELIGRIDFRGQNGLYIELFVSSTDLPVHIRRTIDTTG
jgi:hypothetical protein